MKHTIILLLFAVKRWINRRFGQWTTYNKYTRIMYLYYYCITVPSRPRHDGNVLLMFNLPRTLIFVFEAVFLFFFFTLSSVACNVHFNHIHRLMFILLCENMQNTKRINWCSILLTFFVHFIQFYFVCIRFWLLIILLMSRTQDNGREETIKFNTCTSPAKWN